MQYDVAADFCEDHGGKLPSIISEKESKLFRRFRLKNNHLQ